jgi:hypothetical protein
VGHGSPSGWARVRAARVGESAELEQRGEQARLESLEIVAALQEDADATRGVACRDVADGARHRGEAVGAQRHARERVARVGVEPGGDEHELRRVLVEDRSDEALEHAGVGRVVAAGR